MSKVDKILERAIILELDPDAREKAEKKRVMRENIKTRLQDSSVRIKSGSLIELSQAWDEEIKRCRKKFGKKSAEVKQAEAIKAQLVKAMQVNLPK